MEHIVSFPSIVVLFIIGMTFKQHLIVSLSLFGGGLLLVVGNMIYGVFTDFMDEEGGFKWMAARHMIFGLISIVGFFWAIGAVIWKVLTHYGIL